MATHPQLEKPLEEQILEELEDFVPQSMDPGMVFMLEDQTKLGDAMNPYVAALSCPRCGLIGLITRRQLYAKEHMICAGAECSAEYRIDGEIFVYRQPQ